MQGVEEDHRGKVVYVKSVSAVEFLYTGAEQPQKNETRMYTYSFLQAKRRLKTLDAIAEDRLCAIISIPARPFGGRASHLNAESSSRSG